MQDSMSVDMIYYSHIALRRLVLLGGMNSEQAIRGNINYDYCTTLLGL